MQVSNSVSYSRKGNTHQTCSKILKALGTPLSRQINTWLEEGDYLNVVNSKIDPRQYGDDHALFARDYLACSILRKYSSFPLGIDCKSVALNKFLESEAACRQTNITKVRPYENQAITSYGISPEQYISYARQKIKSLLGKFDWNKASERFAFTGGASTRLKRRSGAPFYKFQGKPETTRNNALLSICAIWSTPLWAEQMRSQYGDDPVNWVTVVEGSRVTTVAKTALTDRCIAIEPEMNMFIQTGIGAVIRDKLRSVGIDLNDQTRNQKLACIGSGTGSLATIDLASASDSIALELVRLLLPYDWFDALCRCRSEVGILPCGLKHPFEKISSMGNGYTFELESLIFWALSKAVIDLTGCSDRRLGVYGDDLIIHNSIAEDLIGLLDYCGFKTNIEKTFIDGPFRESCGKHYFHGKDVTPLYCKEPLDTLNRKFWIANSIRLWASARVSPGRYQHLYSFIVKTIPSKQRYLIPGNYGSECGLWASWDEACPKYSTWKQAFVIRLLVPRRKKFIPNGLPAVLHWFNTKVKDLRVDSLEAGGPSRFQIEMGETRCVPSRKYLSWWDPVPNGVTTL